MSDKTKELTKQLDSILDDAVEKIITKDEETLEKLKALNIEVPIPVPLSHTLETRITHGLTDDLRKQFEECGIELRQSRFTPEEDEKIRRNWKMFQDYYEVDDPEAFFPVAENIGGLPKRQRKKFVQYLGMGLNNRSLNSIYLRFKSLFSQDERKNIRFTDFEDKLILRCMERKIDKPFLVLSKALHRNRVCIYKHYKSMLQNMEYGPVSEQSRKWDLDEKLKLINRVMKVTEVENIRDLEGVVIPNSIWFKVAKHMQRSPSSCQCKWRGKLYTQLFAKTPVYRNKVSLTLLHRLFSLKLIHFQDVNWPEISSKYFPGISSYYLYHFWKRLYILVPERKRKNLQSCVKYLMKNWVPDVLSGKIKEASLTRYRYVDRKTLLEIKDKSK